MRIGWIRGCEIRVHVLLLATMILAGLMGWIASLAMGMIAVVLHECVHAWMASLYGFQVKQLEILPFGSVARIEGLFEFRPGAEAVIALAGPVTNLLLAMITLSIDHYLPIEWAWKNTWIETNLFIAAFNLLPGLPLDGGRVLRAAFACTMGMRKGTRIAAWMGIVLGTVLTLAGGWAAWHGALNPTVCILGVFVVLAAWKERKMAPWLMLRDIADKKDTLLRQESLPVRQIVAKSDMKISSLIGRFLPNRYHLVLVLDTDCNPIGTVSESEVVDTVMSRGAGYTLGEMVQSVRS